MSTCINYPSDRLKYVNKSIENICMNYRKDTFALYRIIGNDLMPRHKKGQSRENLKFILENEQEFPECVKIFIVNRIVDIDEEAKILQILNDFSALYIHIKFDINEYAKVGWDIDGIPLDFAPPYSKFNNLDSLEKVQVLMRLFRFKNNYVMNNNGARNLALRDGKRRAKWVLPWDGNSFLPTDAWEQIRKSIKSKKETSYLVVPMARLIKNSDILNDNFSLVANEEPQIIFRFDSLEEFNEEYYYGRRSKVELLWRLGVEGKWDSWPIQPWDFFCPPYSKQVGNFQYSGWVARLFSGKAELEQACDKKAFIGRGEARNRAVISLLTELDDKVAKTNLNFYQKLRSNQYRRSINYIALGALENSAMQAMKRGTYSVIDKTTLPPSGNMKDYWHPAPYYWPHPLCFLGMPYIRRDGIRTPGTKLYDPLCDRYDRTRLQRFFDDSYTLALAWKEGFGEKYACRGRDLIRRWFLNEESAMNPHLKYAQVRIGHNSNFGQSSGIIEFKDLYYFLDGVRILHKGRFISDVELMQLQEWFAEYLLWLKSSKQGVGERMSKNNHGTFYDLQVAAICFFIEDFKHLRSIILDSRFRLLSQFDENGIQKYELCRSTTAHYCCFNLQGWIYLCQLAESLGEDLWNFRGPKCGGIKKGLEWLLQYTNKEWPYKQIGTFDKDRLIPLTYYYRLKYSSGVIEKKSNIKSVASSKPIFFPHDGIRPFWNLYLS